MLSNIYGVGAANKGDDDSDSDDWSTDDDGNHQHGGGSSSDNLNLGDSDDNLKFGDDSADSFDHDPRNGGGSDNGSLEEWSDEDERHRGGNNHDSSGDDHMYGSSSSLGTGSWHGAGGDENNNIQVGDDPNGESGDFSGSTRSDGDSANAFPEEPPFGASPRDVSHNSEGEWSEESAEIVGDSDGNIVLEENIILRAPSGDDDEVQEEEDAWIEEEVDDTQRSNSIVNKPADPAMAAMAANIAHMQQNADDDDVKQMFDGYSAPQEAQRRPGFDDLNHDSDEMHVKRSGGGLPQSKYFTFVVIAAMVAWCIVGAVAGAIVVLLIFD